MQINETKEGSCLTLAPIGRIDTITSPELEAALKLDGVSKLIVDMAQVGYISSAGLRVLLSAKKKMAAHEMVVANVCPAVKEVFDITGFSDIFTFA